MFLLPYGQNGLFSRGRRGQHPMVTLLHDSQHRKNPQLWIQICTYLRESKEEIELTNTGFSQKVESLFSWSEIDITK